jgi:alcohol dehydrogenase
VRDIPLYAEAFMSGRLPVDRLLTGEIDFENLNKGFDDLDDGVGVRQILNCGL